MSRGFFVEFTLGFQWLDELPKFFVLLCCVFTTGNVAFAFVVGRKIPTTVGTGNVAFAFVVDRKYQQRLEKFYPLDEPVAMNPLDEPVAMNPLDEPVAKIFLFSENLDTKDFLTDNFCEVVMILMFMSF